MSHAACREVPSCILNGVFSDDALGEVYGISHAATAASSVLCTETDCGVVTKLVSSEFNFDPSIVASYCESNSSTVKFISGRVLSFSMVCFLADSVSESSLATAALSVLAV